MTKLRVRMSGDDTIPCETCTLPTQMFGTKRCDRCYEVESRLADYLRTGDRAMIFILRALITSLENAMKTRHR